MMAWKEDTLCDARVRAVETPQLVVRVANKTLLFGARVLFIPGVLIFQYTIIQYAGFPKLVLFPLSTLILYFLFVDSRITRFQLVMERGLQVEPRIKATSRFTFIQQVQIDAILIEVLDDTTVDAQVPDPVWNADHYLLAIPAIIWALTSCGVDVEHDELFSFKAAIIIPPVVVVSILAMRTYCTRLWARVEANDNGVANRRRKVSIDFEEITRARLEWDALFSREYLVLSHPDGEYRLYNHTDDPLYLLRLLKYRMPQVRPAGGGS